VTRDIALILLGAALTVMLIELGMMYAPRVVVVQRELQGVEGMRDVTPGREE
jgi:hypothetical protein